MVLVNPPESVLGRKQLLRNVDEIINRFESVHLNLSVNIFLGLFFLVSAENANMQYLIGILNRNLWFTL